MLSRLFAFVVTARHFESYRVLSHPSIHYVVQHWPCYYQRLLPCLIAFLQHQLLRPYSDREYLTPVKQSWVNHMLGRFQFDQRRMPFLHSHKSVLMGQV